MSANDRYSLQSQNLTVKKVVTDKLSIFIGNYGRRKQASRAKIYTEPRERRFDFSPDKYDRILRSVQGMAGIKSAEKETSKEKVKRLACVR